MRLSRCHLDLINYKLDNVCAELGIMFSNHHNAKADAIGCAEIVLKLAQMNNANNLEDLYVSSCGSRNYSRNKCALFASKSQIMNYSADEDAVRGKSFCFTGKLSYIQRDIAKDVIEKTGGIFKTTISSRVNYLVVGDLSLLGDGYESVKIKKVREYKNKGCNIEVLTEEQFQEIVVYEGPKITKETVDHDSRNFLEQNVANALYGKSICLSDSSGEMIPPVAEQMIPGPAHQMIPPTAE